MILEAQYDLEEQEMFRTIFETQMSHFYYCNFKTDFGIRMSVLMCFSPIASSPHNQSHSRSQGIHKKWKDLLSHQRRKAIIECLQAVPFYKVKRYVYMHTNPN